MREHREKIVKRAAGTVPEQKEAQLIGKRMRQWEDEYFRFIEAGIDATNNPAELTIRQSVMDRVVTQGSRGTAGMSGMNGSGVFLRHVACRTFR
ncbi:MAG: IS66 family transposase [Treponema sp.]|nr:IS66 family transposase [Treponema sp.]